MCLEHFVPNLRIKPKYEWNSDLAILKAVSRLNEHGLPPEFKFAFCLLSVHMRLMMILRAGNTEYQNYFYVFVSIILIRQHSLMGYPQEWKKKSQKQTHLSANSESSFLTFIQMRKMSLYLYYRFLSSVLPQSQQVMV